MFHSYFRQANVVGRSCVFDSSRVSSLPRHAQPILRERCLEKKKITVFATASSGSRFSTSWSLVCSKSLPRPILSWRAPCRFPLPPLPCQSPRSNCKTSQTPRRVLSFPFSCKRTLPNETNNRFVSKREKETSRIIAHLIKHGLRGADEAPSDRSPSLRHANVENLAIVIHIGVISINSVLTGEVVHDIVPDQRRIVRKLQAASLVLKFNERSNKRLHLL